MPVYTTIVAGSLSMLFNSMFNGHVSSLDLAAMSLVLSITLVYSTILSGILYGASPDLTESYKQEKKSKTSEIQSQCGWIVVANAVIALVIFNNILPFLQLAQIDVEIIHHSLPLFSSMSIYLSMLGATYFTSNSLTAIGKTKMFYLLSPITLAIDLLVSAVLVFGFLGFPKFGALGTTIGSIFWALSYLAMLSYLITKQQDIHLNWLPKTKPKLKLIIQIIKIGFPMSLSFLLRMALFAFISILLAANGTLDLASHQIGVSLLFLLLNFPTAIGRGVQSLFGTNNLKDSQFITKDIMWYTLLTSILACCVCAMSSEYIAQIYSSDSQVVKQSSKIIKLSALLFLVESIGTVAGFILLAQKDTTFALKVRLIMFPTIILSIYGVTSFGHNNLESIWYVLLFAGTIFSTILSIKVLNNASFKTLEAS